MPSLYHTQPSQAFQNEVTLPLSEYGFYTLTLTSAAWDYIIVGQFAFSPQGLETINPPSDNRVQKVLLNGQLLLRKGDSVYTVTGQEIQR